MTTLHTLLGARYGTSVQELSAPAAAATATLETLLRHRSVRAFLPNAPLPENTLEWLVAAAQSASTSSNLQAWSVVAVQEPERKSRLAALASNQAQIREAPLFLVWLADLSRLKRVAESAGAPSEGLDTLESFLVGVIDATLAAQNAVVAAEALGLGAVYIGAIRNQPIEVVAELGLPPGVFPVFGLALGVPDPSRPASIKPRLAASLVLHREQYRSAHEAEGVAAYDALVKDFQNSQKLPPVGWVKQVSQRVGAAALGTRARLASTLKTLGFSLGQ